MTTHAIQLLDLFNSAHPLIIPLQLNDVSSYFDVYSMSIEEYKNEDIPKIHLTAEEPINQHKNIQNIRLTCQIIEVR